MNLPDWRDEGAYPDPKRVTMRALAWEFLRRNGEYQDDWADYIERVRQLAAGDAGALEFVRCLELASPEAWCEFARQFDECKTAMRLYDNPGYWVRVEGATAPHWEAVPVNHDTDEHEAVRFDGAMKFPLDRFMGQKWGLRRMENPARAYEFRRHDFVASRTVVEITSVGLRAIELEAGTKHGASQSLGNWLAIAIDLSKPTEVVEAEVLGWLSLARQRHADEAPVQIKNRAQRPSRYVEYLRILDARSEAVPFARIGEVLCPHEVNDPPTYNRDKRLKAAHRAAEQLRDGGYRVLPALQPVGWMARKRKAPG